jgi:hypothetical protein
MIEKQNPWITDRPPVEGDTNARQYWCVQIVDRSGPRLLMVWDDIELQDFPAKTTCVVAWRPIVEKTEGGAA